MNNESLGSIKCVVVGTGGHSRVVISMLQEAGCRYQVVGILDLQEIRPDERILGVPVIGHAGELRERTDPGNIHVFLAIGDNAERAKYYDMVKTLGYTIPNLISDRAHIDPSASMGIGNIICPETYVGPMVQIAHNNILNTRCLIEHETHIGSHNHLGPSSLVAGRVHMGDGIVLGLGAKVIDKIVIVSNTVIGAGAVVVEDIEEPGTYVGIPARRTDG